MIQRFNAFAADDSGQTSLLGSLFSPVTSQLPTKQESVTYYIEAVIAFWVVGGITLYLVNQFSKR